MPKTISASKFKEQCLSILDNLDAEGIVITKRGKAVARLIPVESDCASQIGSMKGKIQVQGDILSTGCKWDAQS
ncbi:MAG: type II toxin-antitoxin system Phd/YefM family antitoxin [Acidobacteria bacterium]|nr:type II toxin-antitoxin system Phd/YefM family antitoxin [Acidobacteriota bacterium]